jgi:AhpC/TSA antioxidant enzyme
LREVDDDFARAGISVRFMTIGSQAKADDYCARHNGGAICIGDPDKHTYAAMGLSDFDLTKLMTTPALLERRNENQAAGFRQDWAATLIWDAAQNPGAAILDRDGVVRWLHRGEHPGDLPPLREMLAQAQAVIR